MSKDIKSREQASLRIKNVTKAFPGVKALSNISLDVQAGHCLGLLGVNGAGKSTLMNIIGGVCKPDSGQVFVNGEEMKEYSPIIAEMVGIGFIHQELLMFDNMTVAENIFLPRMGQFRKRLFIDKKVMLEAASKALHSLGSDLDPLKLVRDVPMGERQIIEIARVMSSGASIILFDEPTSSLSLKERKFLFELINELKDKGKTIIYISHFVNETVEISDELAVLRDGVLQGYGKTAEFSYDKLVGLIVGQNVDIGSRRRKEAHGDQDVMLQIQGLRSTVSANDVNFLLKKGEIVGLWGMLGSGRTELVRTLLGLDPGNVSYISVNKSGKMVKTSREHLMRNCGYITENRQDDGLLLSMSVAENITIASLGRFIGRFRFLKKKLEQEASERFKSQLRISCSTVKSRVASLSGGNQQKVILARWLARNPSIFFLDEPTRGVDVGAKSEMHRLITELADKGSAILIISSEVEEILSLSDRVLVLYRGSIIADLKQDECTTDQLVSLSMGRTQEARV